MSAFDKVSLRLAPNFVEPDTIKNLTHDEQAELLNAIRERRLLIVTQHLQLVESKNKAKEAKLMVKIDKACAKVAKSLAKMDELLAKIELELNAARALRLEVEFSDDISSD